MNASEHLERIKKVTEEISIEPPLPEKLSLELNNTCNHHCVFCPFHSPFLKEEGRMDLGSMKSDLAIRILDQAAELGIGRSELGLFATGEVLLYKDFCEIVKHAKSLGAFEYIYITTNGALAGKEIIEQIINAGIDSIRFSINAGTRESYKEIHGSDDYEKVIENIKYAGDYIRKKNARVNLSVSFVRTKKTMKEVDLLKEQLKNHVDDYICFDAINLDKISSHVYDEYSTGNEYCPDNSKTICGYIFNTMFVNCFGHVCLCCTSIDSLISGYDLNAELDLKQAWNCKLLVDYRKKLLTGMTAGTVCENCYNRNIIYD